MAAIRQNIGRVGLRLRGTWSDNPQDPYMKMDVVEKDGSSYASKVDNNTTTPPSSSWQVQSQRGAVGQGVPNGGSTGQVLCKNSNADYDTKWVNPVEQIQSDWNQSDNTQKDFIKNKPDLTIYVEKEEGKGLSSNDYTDADKAKVETAYQKPNGGIPSTDMSSAVQTSLGKADTALQSQAQANWNETDTDAASYIQNKPDLSVYEVRATIVAPVDETDPTAPITTLACEAGRYYRIDVAVETLVITLPAVVTTYVSTVTMMLTAGTTPAVTISAADSKDVYYKDGFEIEAGKTYEISALFNGSAWVLTSVEIDVESNP